MCFSVGMALLVSFGAFKLANFSYYAATLDFQLVESLEADHEIPYLGDGNRGIKALGADVYEVVSCYLDMPTCRPSIVFMVVFFSMPPAIWMWHYIALAEIRRRVYKQRMAAGILCICAVLPLCAFIAAQLWPGRDIEDFYAKEFARLTERAEPIIQALEAFRKERGAYPNALEELVPKYLAKVPLAGIQVCPEFVYVSQGAEVGGRNLNQPYRWMNSPNREVVNYDLSVSMHKLRSGYASDLFYYLYYRPEEDYPSVHQRFGRWAIVSSGWVRLP